MLTRLQVTGFKNLVDVDVRFGPFTCVAGPNGVGKSNLFDAIRFLSALADKPFVDAAKCVRDESRRTGDVRPLFHQRGGQVAGRMRLVAHMIVPRQGVDQLGLDVVAQSSTFLRYTLELGFVPSSPQQLGDRLELISEELTYVKPTAYRKELPFNPPEEWVRSAVAVGEVRRSPYISTKPDESGEPVVYLHADRNTHLKIPRPARQLNRTILSVATSLDAPTAALARAEMQSWRLLQLEPAALRAPDDFGGPDRLGADGSHLAAALDRLEQSPLGGDVSARVCLRLRQLVEDIRKLDVDRDEKRQLLTLYATDRQNTRLPARSLSDGTLRFLALSVLEEDEDELGVLCFEEPENGIHPARVPAMLQLVQDVAVETSCPVGEGNPLRQVIVNTHSPLVLTGVPEDAVLMAVGEEYAAPGGVGRRVVFLPLDNTWRTAVKPQPRSVPLGELLAFLEPPVPVPPAAAPARNGHAHGRNGTRKVRDRDDVQRTLFDALDVN